MVAVLGDWRPEGSEVPLYSQIEQQLRGLIESGKLPPRSRVPSEVDLAKTYKVSRMTARKAIDSLVNSGLLSRRAGKGTFVTGAVITRPMFSTHDSFVQVMDELGLEHSTTVLVKELIPAPHRTATTLGVADESPVVHIRRLRCVDGKPFQLYEAYLPERFVEIISGDLTGSINRQLEGFGVRFTGSNDVFEAIAAGDEEAELLEVPRGAPLIRIEGLSYDTNQEVVHLTYALFPGNRCRILRESNTGQLGGTLLPLKTYPATLAVMPIA